MRCQPMLFSNSIFRRFQMCQMMQFVTVKCLPVAGSSSLSWIL